MPWAHGYCEYVVISQLQRLCLDYIRQSVWHYIVHAILSANEATNNNTALIYFNNDQNNKHIFIVLTVMFLEL